jgi:hypothetical protein
MVAGMAGDHSSRATYDFSTNFCHTRSDGEPGSIPGKATGIGCGYGRGLAWGARRARERESGVLAIESGCGARRGSLV